MHRLISKKINNLNWLKIDQRTAIEDIFNDDIMSAMPAPTPAEAIAVVCALDDEFDAALGLLWEVFVDSTIHDLLRW